jgi:hypothetical protein
MGNRNNAIATVKTHRTMLFAISKNLSPTIGFCFLDILQRIAETTPRIPHTSATRAAPSIKLDWKLNSEFESHRKER